MKSFYFVDVIEEDFVQAVLAQSLQTECCCVNGGRMNRNGFFIFR